MDDFDKAIQDIIEERVSVLFEIERAVFTERYGLSIDINDLLSMGGICSEVIQSLY
jgi:hypothetical protein